MLEGVADRVWRQRGTGVQQLEANLRRAAPELSTDELVELSRLGMRSYFRYWHEVFRLPSWSPTRIVDTVVTTGEDGLRGGFDQGRGAIIALAAHGQLGPRRRVGVPDRDAGLDRRRAAAARSRCSTGSSPTASRSGWRSSR